MGEAGQERQALLWRARRKMTRPHKSSTTRRRTQRLVRLRAAAASAAGDAAAWWLALRAGSHAELSPRRPPRPGAHG